MTEARDLIAPDLLEILVCPICKGSLVLQPPPAPGPGLGCPACRKVFPIRDGIPVMLVEEALPSD